MENIFLKSPNFPLQNNPFSPPLGIIPGILHPQRPSPTPDVEPPSRSFLPIYIIKIPTTNFSTTKPPSKTLPIPHFSTPFSTPKIPNRQTQSQSPHYYAFPTYLLRKLLRISEIVYITRLSLPIPQNPQTYPKSSYLIIYI